MATINHRDIAACLARHERVAFQLSGGRDSVAALYAMRNWWPLMTVYHLDTGDQFPELAAVVDRIALDVPVLRVRSDAPAIRAMLGDPSDVVPVDNTPFGRLVSGRDVRIVSRYECCAQVVMLPLHERMTSDGITLIVRGQRHEDYATAPMRSGQRDGQFEVLYPIEEWSAADVDAFIASNQLPVAPFYAEGMKTTPDCMTCTAWWGEGRMGYLRRHHPQTAADVSERMRVIAIEVDRQLQAINAD
ncbi:MAG: phosphoadenosine phosphosulfate reductase family protein [Proteobacteria bacterium]|nr:phosphoadenosine phosphosulfate reductase family protein [Pseudomonadota bacterium]